MKKNKRKISSALDKSGSSDESEGPDLITVEYHHSHWIKDPKVLKKTRQIHTKKGIK